MSSGNIRAGVAGVGHLGYHHARIYAAMEGADLIGIVDADAKRGDEVAAEFETSRFDSVEDLIAAGVDCVSVAVPTTYHAEVATKLLSAGVDTLVEKPITATLEEADALVNLAKENDRILQVGHIERFNGAVVALLEAIDQPRFIECHRMSPFPMRGHDVSVVHDLMIHDLEIVLAMDRSGIASADSIGVAVLSPTEDIANVRLNFNSGCVANLTASRVSMEKMRKIRIFAGDAYVSTDYSEQDVMVYRRKGGELAPGANPMELIEIEPLEVVKGEPLARELEGFVQCVRDRSEPVVSGEDGRNALALAQQIIDQIRARFTD